jgi:predicted O-methyltransferase YrrM
VAPGTRRAGRAAKLGLAGPPENPMSVLNDPKLEALLADLHRASKAQEDAIERYFWHERTGPWNGMEPRDHAFMADKMEALDQDKAELCYLLCRAIGARRIFEAGTSYGVSTLYLAAAVRDNGGGVVFAAERETAKTRRARANFAAADLADFIEFHESDVVEAAQGFAGPIDFVLFDIWGHMMPPMVEILTPRLRPGATICGDNNLSEHLDPAAYRQTKLPIAKGFWMAVKE